MSVGRRWTGSLSAAQIPECYMTAATTFASGNDALLSMSSHGSEGRVTDESRTNECPKEKENCASARNSTHSRQIKAISYLGKFEKEVERSFGVAPDRVSLTGEY